GDLHLRRAGEDEQESRVARGVRLEVFEQRVASLVAIDAPQIKEVVAVNAERFHQLSRWRRRRLGIEAGADDGGRLESVMRARRDERFFFGREEEVAGGTAEELAQHLEIDRRILFGRRQQNRAVADERQ